MSEDPRPSTMHGVRLPGDSTVRHVELPVPRPGPGQVLVGMRASSICGSDIRAIYREHLGTGDEAYRGVVAGHEPAGEIVALGEGCRRFGIGDRVALYHIAGCGLCGDCRRGYMISCTSSLRAAYGWQRDGGHADYLLAEERTCVAIPPELSFVDGALVACGFGTAWEALWRLGVSGRDELLVVGLGPVGLAAGFLAKLLGARHVVGVEPNAERAGLAREIAAVDVAVGPEPADELRERFDASVDCSGSAAGRSLAIHGTRRWGRCALVGEGGALSVDASEAIIHRQLVLHGSWVTSVGRMEELMGVLAQAGLRPEATVTHTFGLDEADAAYAVADGQAAGKVCITLGA